MDSPTFYDVSTLDFSGQRTLLPHSLGILRSFRVRSAQVGALGLPIIVDKSGRMLQVQRVQSVVSSQACASPTIWATRSKSRTQSG